MALKAALTPLVLAATQGSADAFVQGSVATALSGNQAYNIKSIEFEWSNAPYALSANMEISVSLTRRSKAAMPLISDTDVIFKRQLRATLVTSGIFVIVGDPFGTIYVPQLEIPIVEETLYLQVDSTATGQANVLTCRLGVVLDTMSPIDRLNLIARSLT